VGTLSWLATSRMRRAQCLWCWTSALHMRVEEVALTLRLMETYITLMIWIGHLMRLLMIRFENIALIIITILRMLSPLCQLLLVRLGGYIVNLCAFYSYTLIGKLTAFLQLQEVGQIAQSKSGLLHFRRAAFSWQLRAKVGSTRAKAAALRVNLNLDGAPITSSTHTHPSHSQTSRLLTLSLSLGVPVPRATQCMRGA
jgi:hypothetical protein